MPKIAILSHFGTFQDSYALHVGWHERAKMMEYFDCEFDFLVNDNCVEGGFPRQINILKRIKESEPFEERVKFFEEMYLEILKPYDIVLTADLVYQQKGNFLAQNQAMRNASKKLKAKWRHWVHSGWVSRREVAYPESLRYSPLPKGHIVVCLSNSERSGVAQMYGMTVKDVIAIHNPKDFRAFQDFDELSWRIIKEMDIPNKDVVQLLPFCSTRMESKGVARTIDVIAALKRAGRSVALVLANANSRSVQSEILEMKSYATAQGLIEGAEFLFTSDWLGNSPVPRKTIADIFSVANIFAFASYRETASNVLYEAKISGCLLVLNSRVPALAEGGGPDAVYFPATHQTYGTIAGQDKGDRTDVAYNAGNVAYFDTLAKNIIPKLPNKSYLWEWSYEAIWKEMAPVLGI